MNRIVVLLVITLLLVAGVFVGYWGDWFGDDPRVRTTSSDPEPVKPLPAVDRNLVSMIQISDKDGSVKLVKRESGWVLPDSFDAPALKTRVDNLLKSIDKVGGARFVARRNPAKYELEGEAGRHLVLQDDKGTTLLDVLVGKQDRSGGLGAGSIGTYVRRPGEEPIFRVRAAMAPNLHSKAELWLERRILSDFELKDLGEQVKQAAKVSAEFDDLDFNPQSGADQVSVLNANPQRLRVVLEKREVETQAPAPEVGPTPPGTTPPAKAAGAKTTVWKITEPAEAAALDVYGPFAEGIVRNVLYARLEEVVGRDPSKPEYGLDQPVIQVTLNLEDGTTYDLKIGAKVPQEEGGKAQQNYVKRYAYMTGTPFVVTINQFTCMQLAKKPEDLQKPEAPTAAPLGGRPAIQLPGKDSRPTTRKG